MLIQWKRERLQMTLAKNADPSELNTTVAWEVDNRGITNPQVIQLAKALGLATVPAMTPTIKHITYLLQYYGPLWTNGREHIVVIGGIDDTNGGFLVYDPSPINKGCIEWRPYNWYFNSSSSVPDSRDTSREVQATFLYHP
jgi:hypothetical protein